MRRWISILLLGALVGCPGEGPGVATPPVTAGQRYRFVQTAASGTEQVYEVVDVSEEGVLYRVQTLVQGTPEGEPSQPLTLRFPLPLEGTPPEGTQQVTVGGATFLCRVETVGSVKIYTALEGGSERFPGVVKITTDGAVSYALTAIE